MYRPRQFRHCHRDITKRELLRAYISYYISHSPRMLVVTAALCCQPGGRHQQHGVKKPMRVNRIRLLLIGLGAIICAVVLPISLFSADGRHFRTTEHGGRECHCYETTYHRNWKVRQDKHFSELPETAVQSFVFQPARRAARSQQARSPRRHRHRSQPLSALAAKRSTATATSATPTAARRIA